MTPQELRDLTVARMEAERLYGSVDERVVLRAQIASLEHELVVERAALTALRAKYAVVRGRPKLRIVKGA